MPTVMPTIKEEGPPLYGQQSAVTDTVKIAGRIRMKYAVTAAAVLAMAASLAWAEGDAPAQGGAERRGKGAGNPEAHFKAMDKNDNGVIDKDEFPGPAEKFAKIDADNSGTLSKEEIKAHRGARREGAGNPEERFKAMDKNGNGVIDKDEFRGPAERFGKIDADNSGTITKEEMKAAHEKMRAKRDAAPQDAKPKE
jgi:hypothetical protein